MNGVLKTHPSVFELLDEKNIDYFHAETPQCVDKYNELVAQGHKVGGIFHSTC